MGIVVVQVQGRRDEIEQTDLIREVRKILPTLENICDTNANAINNGYGKFWRPRIEPRNDYISFNLESMSNILEPSDVENLTKEIRRVLNSTLLVIESCDKEEPIFDQSFFYTLNTSTADYNGFWVGRIIKSEICPHCQTHYTKIGLASHIGSLRCIKDAQCLDLINAGYTIIDDSAAVTAIRKSGIEYQIRPAALDMWVPRWVAQAVKDYRKNKAFAGLKLHEFLKALKGNG